MRTSYAVLGASGAECLERASNRLDLEVLTPRTLERFDALIDERSRTEAHENLDTAKTEHARSLEVDDMPPWESAPLEVIV
jgi:hypothetical protein